MLWTTFKHFYLSVYLTYYAIMTFLWFWARRLAVLSIRRVSLQKFKKAFHFFGKLRPRLYFYSYFYLYRVSSNFSYYTSWHVHNIGLP